MPENNDFRIFSRLELLVNLRNETENKIVRQEVNVEYFQFKQKLYPKKTPEHNEAKASLDRMLEGLKFDRILLKIIDEHIEIEKKAEKEANKPKGSN